MISIYMLTSENLIITSAKEFMFCFNVFLCYSDN